VGALADTLRRVDTVTLRCTLSQDAKSAVLMGGGMQATVREIGGDDVEVTYEHAEGEATTERCSPAAGALLIAAIFARTALHRLPVPG
jgi:hypothetical protein